MSDPAPLLPAPLLEVRNLSVGATAAGGRRPILRDVSFQLGRGETLGIVGESGSGKSVSARTILGLLPPALRADAGAIVLDGERDLLAERDKAMRELRGKTIGAIFQDPMSGLNPVVKIGRQMQWVARRHDPGLSRAAARATCLEHLDLVGLPDPRRVYGAYPHELSGGMRQRVLIALATVPRPRILIADEPTTALDVTTQHRVLGLLEHLQRELDLSLLFISHDFAVVSRLCRRIVVMYAGSIVEDGAAGEILGNPRHHYTAGLLAARPALDAPLDQRLVALPGSPLAAAAIDAGCRFRDRCAHSADLALCAEHDPPLRQVGPVRVACHFPRSAPYGTPLTVHVSEPAVTALEASPTAAAPIVAAADVTKVFGRRGATVTAVNGVNVAIAEGASVGLVGESGSGKTTLSRILLGLTAPTSGTVRYRGDDLRTGDRKILRKFRSEVQLVQQNPYTALNPRLRVGQALAEPLRVRKVPPGEIADRLEGAIEAVGLGTWALERKPGAFSGGQRQRIAIARALVLQPRLLVLDEPVSALDASVQAQVLNLLVDLRDRLGLSYLFISHDLSVVRYVCSDVYVMLKGDLVESGDVASVFADPQHSYTRALLESVPSISAP